MRGRRDETDVNNHRNFFPDRIVDLLRKPKILLAQVGSETDDSSIVLLERETSSCHRFEHPRRRVLVVPSSSETVDLLDLRVGEKFDEEIRSETSSSSGENDDAERGRSSVSFLTNWNREVFVLVDELEHDLDVGRFLELGDVSGGESYEESSHPGNRAKDLGISSKRMRRKREKKSATHRLTVGRSKTKLVVRRAPLRFRPCEREKRCEISSRSKRCRREKRNRVTHSLQRVSDPRRLKRIQPSIEQIRLLIQPLATFHLLHNLHDKLLHLLNRSNLLPHHPFLLLSLPFQPLVNSIDHALEQLVALGTKERSFIGSRDEGGEGEEDESFRGELGVRRSGSVGLCDGGRDEVEESCSRKVESCGLFGEDDESSGLGATLTEDDGVGDVRGGASKGT